MSEVREQLRKLLKARPDLHVSSIATHTTCTVSAVQKFLADDQIRGGTDRVEEELRRVMQQVAAGEILRAGGDNAITLSDGQRTRKRVTQRHGFYETETVRRISQVLDFCAERALIGVVTADFGVGKTEALQRWRQTKGRNSESIVFEFTEFEAGNKIAMIEELAKTLGVPYTPTTNNASRTFQAVCNHLKENPCLLIFDQCEMVRPRVFQVIRQIWDRCRSYGVGIVLFAAPILLAKLRLTTMQDMGALSSRIGICAPLEGLSKSEMAQIVKAEGFADVDEAAFDLWYRAINGSMRQLFRFLDLLQARYAGKRVTERTISDTGKYLFGLNIEAGGAA